MIRIPPNGKWVQRNRSDVFGSIWSSWNLDLTTNEGKLRVSPRGVITTDDITNLGVAIGFERFNGGSGNSGFYTVAGDRAFKNGAVDASVAFADGSGATTHSSDTADIMFFRKANRLVTSFQTSLQSNNATSWATVAGSPLVSGTVHMMCEYGNKGYVTDNYKTVISFDTSMNTTTAGNPNTFSLGALSLDNIGLMFTKLLAASDRIWLFTLSAAIGQPCSTFAWDGATQDDPMAEYVHEHGGVLAATLIHDVPYVMTVEGFLEVFNGGTFAKVPNSRLPVNPTKFLKNSFSGANDRWIHPNGMISIENRKINILINNEYHDGTFEENLPAGVWEFDLDDTSRGWYHKLPLSLYASTVTDFGQSRVSRVGGLYYAKTPTGNGTLLMGAQLYSDATATKEVIETNNTADTIQKFGYVVTTKIPSQNLEDEWQSLYVRCKKLLASTDAIIAKYRTSEVVPTEATITWTSTTTCTTTTDVSAFVGYEMEVLQGKGGGKCSKITSAVNNAGTYTITLQETFTGASSGTAKARFQYWIEIGKLTNQALKFFQAAIGVPDTWIQFKLCMQFTGIDEVEDLLLENKKHQ